MRLTDFEGQEGGEPEVGQLVCTRGVDFGGPPTAACRTAYSEEKQVKWNN